MESQHYRVFVGTYAAATKPGIYQYRMDGDSATGALVAVRQDGGMQNPSYLEIDAAGHVLYAVGEGESGQIAAFAIGQPDNPLTLLSTHSTHGGSPCHIALHPAHGVLVCANYMGGNLSLHPLDAAGGVQAAVDVVTHTGRGVRADRQEQAHPHSAWLDPTGQFILVPDLGMDEIVLYRIVDQPPRFARQGSVRTEPGAGPRHFAFHPHQPVGYGLNELNSTITAFAFDSGAGQLQALQTVPTLPPDLAADTAAASTAAHLVISPEGRFLYASNRGHDSIAVFAIDGLSGALTPIQHEFTRGRVPRHFAQTPDGRFLVVANQGSDSITTFRIHPDTGQLSFTGHSTQVPRPSCVQVRRWP